MPKEPEPSSQSESPSTDSFAAVRRAHAQEVREMFAAEDAYRNKLRRERLARERRAAEEEPPPSKSEKV